MNSIDKNSVAIGKGLASPQTVVDHWLSQHQNNDNWLYDINQLWASIGNLSDHPDGPAAILGIICALQNVAFPNSHLIYGVGDDLLITAISQDSEEMRKFYIETILNR